MRKGFIFNNRLCVGCKACSAACMLENGWIFTARQIFIHNPEAFAPGPVINISMACNHCKDPLCLIGCPASAYDYDTDTGAVVIDQVKCIGCRYCTWNCPYDAPRFNEVKGIIEKCHFCNHLIRNGAEPACSSACPTGALGYGDIPDIVKHDKVEILPGKELNPSWHFTGETGSGGPEIVPSVSRYPPVPEPVKGKLINRSDSSLVAFTFLSALSVSFVISGIITANSTGYLYSLIAILLAGFISFFHLRSKLKAWRSLANFRLSPLSREISALVVYSSLLAVGQFADSILIKVLIAVSGLILLILIDSVYSFTTGKVNRFHSGQVFITSLLIISFLTLQTLPFLFIAALKLIIIFRSGQLTAPCRTFFVIRFIRVALLFISGMILITVSHAGEVTSIIVLLTGELIDRFLFYSDFEPLNINETIKNQINISSDEKNYN